MAELKPTGTATVMKQATETTETPEEWRRFTDAMKHIVTVPKEEVGEASKGEREEREAKKGRGK